MAGSQLKRLKASLKEQGIIGPQQSKKQKKKAAEDARASGEKRLRKSVALETIRDQFNPFQFKMNARGPKFQVTTNKPAKAVSIKGRPGVALAASEERRRQTLLVDMQRRQKVGGILDRRFGEDDPTLTPEEKAMQRFALEKQRSHKKSAMFDLEDDEEGGGLTHLGKSLSFDDAQEELRDDFDEGDIPLDDDDEGSDDLRKKLKRWRDEAADMEEEEGEDGMPARKKTKQEVYKEIIAKSKAHKYERMVARDEDDELRAEIDKELPDLQAILFASKKPEDDKTNKTSGQAQKGVAIPGFDKAALDKTYDMRLKQMIQDKRAVPTERTKTEEELAEERAAHLKQLEEDRVRRMLGQPGPEEEEDSESDSESDSGAVDALGNTIKGGTDVAGDFGLGKTSKKARPTAAELGYDDEDDFLIEDDLVASGSDLELEDDSEAEDSEAESAADSEEEEDEFTKGLLTEEEKRDPIFAQANKAQQEGRDDADGIPYTFPCPESYGDLCEVVRSIPISKHPTVVRRIRELYHPKLASGNKEKLGRFAAALVKHIAGLGNGPEEEELYATIETLIRHVHSLAKLVPIEIANAFREHLQETEKERPLMLDNGDLVMLTAIGTIFPGSDAFHQVVTPAMLCMARYLGQKIPQSLSDYATGTYLSILCLQQQQFSKRYVPEFMNFTLNTLLSLDPTECRNAEELGFFPIHPSPEGTRIRRAQGVASIRKLAPRDCWRQTEGDEEDSINERKLAILSTTIAVLAEAAVLYTGKPAFLEIFAPARTVLKHLNTKSCRSQLPAALNQEVERALATVERLLKLAQVSRRPLEEHHHRPLAIRTYIPKFEETYDPDKHYDPNRERAEAAKLKAEYRRERKAAMRELRKDASFMARENLRIKKAKDAAYDKKFKRLVAEIQGEEGHAANTYEREKKARQGKRR